MQMALNAPHVDISTLEGAARFDLDKPKQALGQRRKDAVLALKQL